MICIQRWAVVHDRLPKSFEPMKKLFSHPPFSILALCAACGLGFLLSACAGNDGQPTERKEPAPTAEEQRRRENQEKLKKQKGAVPATFLGIGGTLEEAFTGNRTVDRAD